MYCCVERSHLAPACSRTTQTLDLDVVLLVRLLLARLYNVVIPRAPFGPRRIDKLNKV